MRTVDDGRACVLVVDDELSVRVLVSLLLESAGYEPVAVPSVDRALARLDEHGADLVVTDLVMPGLGGLDLLAALRRRASRIPVIAMTGSDDERLIGDAFELGAATVIRKPFSAELLRATIDAALSSGRAAA
jgi:CheY-like chemotaxis protein